MDIGFGMRLVRRIDFYACWLARVNINEAREMRISRPRRCTNVALLVGLVAAVAASANFPVLVSSIFWRNMTTRGAVVGGRPRVDFRSAADAVLKVGMGRRPASRARASVPR